MADDLLPTGITALTGEALVTTWKYVYNMLKPIVEENGENMPDLYTSLMEERAQLVVYVHEGMLEGAIVTEVLDFGSKKSLNILYLAGKDRKNWLKYLPRMEEWAKGRGIDSILIARGREGWKEILKPYGYKVQAIILEKELK